MRKSLDQIDIVTITMSVLLMISFLIPNFMSFLKSRVNMPSPISAYISLGNVYWAGIAAVLFFVGISFIKRDHVNLKFITGISANLLLVLFVYTVSAQVMNLPFEHTNSSRISFNIGFVLMVIALYGIMLNCGNYLKKHG